MNLDKLIDKTIEIVPKLWQWVAGRNRRRIAQLIEGRNHAARPEVANLYAEEIERRQFQEVTGIPAGHPCVSTPQGRKALMDIAEILGGWSDIRSAQSYLISKEKGVDVRFKRSTWAYWWLRNWVWLASSVAFLLGLVAVVLFFYPYSFVPTKFLPAAKLPPFWICVTFSLYMILLSSMYAAPAINFWASRRVERVLESLPVRLAKEIEAEYYG